MLKRLTSYIFASTLPFLLGALASLALVVNMTPVANSPALRLPDQFATVEHGTGYSSSQEYISFFIGSPELVWGEIAVPPEAHTNGVMTQIYYTANNGQRLIHANLSGANGQHTFEVVDWDKNVVAYVHSEDVGARAVRITDAGGNLLAQGNRNATTGAFTLNSSEGQLLATISPSDGGMWSVSVEHCSKITHVVYALLAGYESILSTGKAVTI